jgi:hypothetical protein
MTASSACRSCAANQRRWIACARFSPKPWAATGRQHAKVSCCATPVATACRWRNGCATSSSSNTSRASRSVPFIWHVWDGHKEGFSALVNYHLLTREKLNTLINLYLGDWITQQKRAVDAGNTDATLKLAKAEALKAQLEAILEGEPPYDIFVRWKPLHQLPIGWDPDLNDGVRMNIRPFVEAAVLRIPRARLGIKWQADRGKDVASAPWYKLGPTYGEPEGTRINDHHTRLAEKKAARAAAPILTSDRFHGGREKTAAAMLELLQSPALRNLPKSDADEMARRIDEQRNGWQDV